MNDRLITMNLLLQFFLDACAFFKQMQVGPQGQKQSVDSEGYPSANLTGDWGAPGKTAEAKEQSPEGTNKNTAFLNVKL